MSIRDRWADRKSRAPTIIARDRAIEKAALVESAERIYLRYLLPGAEREIYLPSVVVFIHRFGADRKTLATIEQLSHFIPRGIPFDPRLVSRTKSVHFPSAGAGCLSSILACQSVW